MRSLSLFFSYRVHFRRYRHLKYFRSLLPDGSVVVQLEIDQLTTLIKTFE